MRTEIKITIDDGHTVVVSENSKLRHIHRFFTNENADAVGIVLAIKAYLQQYETFHEITPAIGHTERIR